MYQVFTANAVGRLAVLLLAVTALLAAVEGSRTLQQCNVESIAIAGSTSERSVAEAVSKAFAECKELPPDQSCDAIARSNSEAIAQAAATALAQTAGSVQGGPGCVGQAEAQASSTATSYAQAYAQALANAGCQGNAAAQTSNTAVQDTFAQAAAQASTKVTAENGDAAASATAIAQSIATAVASALATALANCA